MNTFSLCMLQGIWDKDSEWVWGIEKWKAKNDKQGTQWYILTWEITEKRLQRADVGVWKWYVNVTTIPVQIISLFLLHTGVLVTGNILLGSTVWKYWLLSSLMLTIWSGDRGETCFHSDPWYLLSHDRVGYVILKVSSIFYMFLVQRVILSFALWISKETTSGFKCS